MSEQAVDFYFYFLYSPKMRQSLLVILLLASTGFSEGGGSSGGAGGAGDGSSEAWLLRHDFEADVVGTIPVVSLPDDEEFVLLSEVARDESRDGTIFHGEIEVAGGRRIIFSGEAPIALRLEPSFSLSNFLKHVFHEGLSVEFWFKRALELRDAGSASFLLAYFFNLRESTPQEVANYFAELPELATLEQMQTFLEALTLVRGALRGGNDYLAIQIMFALIQRSIETNSGANFSVLLTYLYRFVSRDGELDANYYFALVGEMAVRFRNMGLLEQLLEHWPQYAPAIANAILDYQVAIAVQVEENLAALPKIDDRARFLENNHLRVQTFGANLAGFLHML